MFDKKLLSLLACPACEKRPPLNLDEKEENLICAMCAHVYKIQDGIPILLVEEEKGA